VSKVSLKDAEEAHKAVITSQQKQITNLYEKWADEMAEQAKKYASSKNPSAALKSQQITQLEGALRKAGEQTANAVNSSVKQSMARASQAVVASNAEWMEKLGFPEGSISAAFSSVPTEIVQNIITGQVYEGGWSLAKSIWGDNEDTLSKAYEMVAGGIAENKSVYDIAKDLEQYVRPSAKKPWNYTFKSVDKVTGKEKTYRVYPKKVDYNAQRLARTLSQHAYQQTMVAVNKDNPFVQKFRWHVIGGRACPICLARNGKLFDKNNVPMDHPNGMCILEPVYDEDVNQRLADWVNGKEDPALDRYAKQFGATPGDIAVKEGERKKTFLESLNESEKEAIREYTGYVYSGVNSYLRGNEAFGTKDVKKIVKNIDSAMSKASIEESIEVFRGDDMRGLQGLMQDGGRRSSWYEKGKNLFSLIGKVVTNDSYMSTSAGDVLDQYKRGVIYHVSVPEGAQAADISSISRQKSEREILINRGQEFEIADVKCQVDDEGYVYGEVHVYLKLKKKT
jgi:hypothetical protein